jgi:CRISPR-associated protein Cmr4
VDNSIVREPGTRLPKIPGTSLSGAIRQYAAYRNGRRECAGQGKNHHKSKDDRCPVCYTFGTANEAGSGFRGWFRSAMLAWLFPLLLHARSGVGHLPAVLKECGIDYTGTDVLEDQALFAEWLEGSYLNLGWLMVTKKRCLELA